jgi:S1-C subfamily serine protease
MLCAMRQFHYLSIFLLLTALTAFSETPHQPALVRGFAPPALGMVITVDTTGEVRVGHVLPGSAAADVGLESGDQIVELAGERLDGGGAPMAVFQRRMGELDLAQPVALVYRRGQLERYVELQPPANAAAPGLAAVMGMAAPTGAIRVGPAAEGQLLPGPGRFVRAMPLQLAPVSAALGRYFGVDHGVLVVAGTDQPEAPDGLQDGDVILRIDGEAVANVGEVMMRLMMRDQASATLDVMRDHTPMSVDWSPSEPESEAQLLPQVPGYRFYHPDQRPD